MRFTILWVLIFASSSMLMAQDAMIPVTKVQVNDSIYMLKGKGGNIGVSFGTDGVLVIDSQFAEASPQVIAAIKELSDKPIRFLINTHHHGDHVGGNENLSKEGAVLFAHENVRSRILKKQNSQNSKSVEKAYNEGLEKAKKDANSDEEASESAKRYAEQVGKSLEAEYISPMITYSGGSTFYYNGEKIMLFHIHKAHTDGDTMIYFTESNVIHTGDAYIKGKYPFVDVNSGGSMEGYINGLQKILTLADEDTVIIPGHGDIASIKDVKETHSMMKYLKDRVAYYYVKGKTLDEIIALDDVAKPFDDKGFGGGFISTREFIKVFFNAAEVKYENRRGN